MMPKDIIDEFLDAAEFPKHLLDHEAVSAMRAYANEPVPDEGWGIVQGWPYDEQKCQEVADQLHELGTRIGDPDFIEAALLIQRCIETAKQINEKAGARPV